MLKQKKFRPPIKCHGGKFYLSKFVIDHFPANYEKYDYVEPYVGGGSVFLNKKRSIGTEVINDIDLGIVSILRSLKDAPNDFIGRLKRVKYSESTFKRMEKRKIEEANCIDIATREFVLRRMSRGGLKNAFAWSERTRGGQPGDVNAWQTIIEQLPRISERLQHVHILNEFAINVIKAFDDENILIYVDPPYLPETRTSPDVYDYEMTIDDHAALAECLNRLKGKVVLSGYPSQLYKRLYKTWKCYKKKMPNHASQQKKKKIKTEMLWTNF